METVETREIILKEFPSFLSSLPGIGLTRRTSCNESGIPLLTLTGYGATKHFYYGLWDYFEKRKYRSFLADFGINVRRFTTSMKIVEQEITELFQPHEQVTIIGHSLGGAIGVAALALSPIGKRIKRVIALGTPFLGCPWKPLELLVRFTTGISEKTFHQNRKKIKEVSHKIISISSPYDKIAPPECCRIPNSYAQHINLGEVFPDAQLGHLDLIRDKHVWVYIESLLKEQRRLKKLA